MPRSGFNPCSRQPMFLLQVHDKAVEILGKLGDLFAQADGTKKTVFASCGAVSQCVALLTPVVLPMDR